jgi:DNA polymerase III subunit epsilon
MTVLCFDCETTGLPSYGDPSDSPTQPHLVELALGMFTDDGEEIDVRSMIVRPDGWTIGADTTAIHRITHDHAIEVGITEARAAAAYAVAVEQATIRVAHNEPFDRRIMRIAMLRNGWSREQIERLEARPKFDTCTKARKVTNLPPTGRMQAAGFNWPKNPKLRECVTILFGEDLDEAHDAMRDVRACARVYFLLRSLGIEP